MASRKELNLICWYPHSGCRWLNRSLLAKHSQLHTSEFFLPWLSHSTDMTLNLDRTSQVHKSRSLSELKDEFERVKKATEIGRKAGIESYIQLSLAKADKGRQFVGALSPGAPEPLNPDIDSILDAYKQTKIIHLVRDPYACFHSMKSRFELDGDPIKVASTWLAYNSKISFYKDLLKENYFFLKYEDLKRDTEFSLKRICDWMGISFEEEMLEGVQAYHGKNQGKKPLEDIGFDSKTNSVFWEIVKCEAAKYGYEKL